MDMFSMTIKLILIVLNISKYIQKHSKPIVFFIARNLRWTWSSQLLMFHLAVLWMGLIQTSYIMALCHPRACRYAYLKKIGW